jgi:type II secretory pathway component PulM
MMNHYKEIAFKRVSQAFNRVLSSIKTLFNGADLWRILNANKKRLAILVSVLCLSALLIWFAKPYLEMSQPPIALKVSQSIHLKNLIIESKALNNDLQLVNQLDDRELEEFKKLLISKGMKVGHLSIQTKNDPSIQMQLKYVSFAAFIDLLNESRIIWHLYPIDVSVEATDSAGIVHINATLIQFRSNQSSPSSSSPN